MSSGEFRELVLQEASRFFRHEGRGCKEMYLALALGLEQSQVRACVEELVANCLVWVRGELVVPIPDAQRQLALNERARRILARAVRDGRIRKPEACGRCQAPTDRAKLRGHIRDHLQPLEVEWLCAACYHVENPDAARGGRPPAPSTIARVRLPNIVYDAYCRRSTQTGDSVHSVMQKVLMQHAPRDSR